ncbi:TlpA disulfide reductase family protein [Pseudofrankia sp. BMG5.37]|uniref:TlpA family protein disulfide reductase n=1 Tax=Pseudofrankia sp. BMG5.36 TaxID=1834512 RepID=UPI001F51BCBD|nr:TlpA disulfide reductase family protein [Pseudofrankia sp. BMG5.36]MDT3438627.1 TlpA disulfide reductase family protein [Pseudofrankia sp. BMG5.37]
MRGRRPSLGGARPGTRRRIVGLAGAPAALALAVGLGLSGCSTGSTAVDATGGGSFGFVQQSAGQDFVPPAERKPAPKLAGDTLTGEKLDVASLRGKPVVINFWASWCAPCREETPHLVELAGQRPGVAFVGVNEEPSTSPGLAFVRDYSVSYPSISDKKGILSAGWPIALGLPSTVVLDGKGQIAARFTGPVSFEALAGVLDQMAAET